MSKKVYFLISFVLALSLVGIATAQSPGDLELWAEYLFEPGEPNKDTGPQGFHISSGDIMTGVSLGVYEGYDSKGAYHGDIGPYDGNTGSHPNVPFIYLPPEAWPGGLASGNVTFEMMLYFDEEWALAPNGPMQPGDCGDPPGQDLYDIHGHREEDWWDWFDQVPLYAEGSSLMDLAWMWEHGQVNDVTGDYWMDVDFWHGGLDYAGYTQWVQIEKETWYHWVVSIDDDNGIIRQWVDASPGGCPGGCIWPEPVCFTGTYSPGDFTGDISLLTLGGADESSPVRGRIDWVRFYRGYTETALSVPGKVRVSNESPENGADHVRPDANLCFQASEQAGCMDPNADPNLKGPFEYDVWFGTDPCSLGLIVDACQPDECNAVHCFDPCDGGNLADGTRYYWRVDINDANGSGDPCFYEGPLFGFRTWGVADDPEPRDGASGIKPSVILSWVEDDYAVSRDIYFDTNEAAVTNATTANTATYPGVYRGSTAPVDPCDPNRNTYDPPELLDLLSESFWRIDEVNTVAVKGDVWSFETSSYFVVDDFEPYLNLAALTAVWTTGHLTNNGAQLQIFFAKTDESKVIDEQSMEFAYRNQKSGSQYRGSEAVANVSALQSGSDWTRGGVKALVLYFYGRADNGQEGEYIPDEYHITNDQMYVAVEDGGSNVGIVKWPDMNDIQEEEWQEWNIDLADPCLAAVDMNNVAKVYIGFGGAKTGQSAGGAGTKSGAYDTVWFDDIQLHPPRCVTSEAYPYGDLDEDCVISVPDLDIMSEVWLDKDFEAPVVPPNDANLTVWYKFDNPSDGYDGLSDSSAMGYHGIAVNDVSVHDGMLTLMNENTWQTYGYTKNGVWDYPAEMNAVEIPFPNQVDVWNNSYTIFIEARTHLDNTGLAWENVWPIMYMSVSDPVAGAVCDPDGFEITWYQAYDLLVQMLLNDPNEWAANADHACKGSSAEYGTVADADWHKIVWTYDAGSGWHKCYVDVYGDGGFEPWDETPYEFDNGLNPSKPWKTLIGASYGRGSTGVIYEEGTSFMTGDVNEIRIYDYAVSLGEALALLGLEGIIYVPLNSPANYVPKDPCDSADPNLGSGVLDPNNLDIINFRDYLVIANNWLKEILWPLE